MARMQPDRWSEDRMERIEWQLNQIRGALVALVFLLFGLPLLLVVLGGLLGSN